jgi:hypothetical protein
VISGQWSVCLPLSASPNPLSPAPNRLRTYNFKTLITDH